MRFTPEQTEALGDLKWNDLSADTFWLMKAHYGLDATLTWQFSIDTPDLPKDEMTAPTGEAAFMLRRIQALRFLLADPAEAPPDLVLAHASELHAFLLTLGRTLDGVTDPNPQNQVLLQTIRQLNMSLKRVAEIAWKATASDS